MTPLASKRWLALALLMPLAVRPAAVAAQEFGFEPPAAATDAELPAVMRDLAERIVPVYREEETDRYLSNLAILQLVAGDAAAAQETRLRLEQRRRTEQETTPDRAVVYDVYTLARSIEATQHVSFANAFSEALRARFNRLGDLDAYKLKGAFTAPTAPLREALQRVLDQQRGKAAIALEPAIEAVRAWFAFEAYRSFEGLVRPLLAEDDERRYIVDPDVAIPVGTDDAGPTLAATLVRPRGAEDVAMLPTVLELTLDRSSRDPLEAAAHGYASVLALARIAGEPEFRPRAPFETDGDDARAAIAWIAKQPWSDGRVAMQGVGYGGFVAWSAAKQPPAALRAIATVDPIAPGIDVPMWNGIFRNSAYRWLGELLAEPDEPPHDAALWARLDEDWYRSGRRYRDFPTLSNQASAVFRSWLNHPSYDRFWQKWLPFREEFAGIEIPVLTVTGYYSAGETAALYYFTEHHRYDPDARHTLLIGPFDEQSVESGPSSSVRGLPLDPVARIDADDVRFAWLAYALNRAQRPALLADRVNYEVAGTNEWRHAPSLAALEDGAPRFYLAASPSGAPPHVLSRERASEPQSIPATLDLRDRDDAAWRPSRDLVLPELAARAGTLLFESAPLPQTLDVAGRISGVLDFTVNKYDVDLVLMLYELRADGQFVKLFEPAYAFRASYAVDRVQRRLLRAGVRQQLPFQSQKVAGRRVEAGSRLVLALGINKRADQQINYGAAGDVSEEWIEDAGAPVRIRWHEGSYVAVPARPVEPPPSPEPQSAP